MSKDSSKKHYIRILAVFWILSILRNLRRIYSTTDSKLPASLLLIAHPDDESMFFSPFLFHNSPLIICLSKGDFHNEGERRVKEMEHLCNSRNWNLKLLDHKDGESWDENIIMIEAAFECILNDIENVVTFDERGVSGHQNHISCYKAMKKLQKYSILINKLNAWPSKYNSIVHRIASLQFHYLKSTNIIEKYMISFRRPSYKIPIYSIFAIRNMIYHKSQLLWFRYIYIMISSYMNFNEF